MAKLGAARGVGRCCGVWDGAQHGPRTSARPGPRLQTSQRVSVRVTIPVVVESVQFIFLMPLPFHLSH